MGRETPNARATEATDAPESTQSSTLARDASGAGERLEVKRRARRSAAERKEVTVAESPGETGEECKARTRKARKTPPKKPSPFSRPWFAEFLADALKTNDVPGSCARADVTMVDLIRARQCDPAIDAAMIEVDELQRMMAINAVVAAAAAGDLRAVKALTDGSLDVLTRGLTPDEPEHILMAMDDAKRRVLAEEAPQPWRITTVVCPCCSEEMTLEFRDVIGQPGRITHHEVLLIQYAAADGSTRSRYWYSRDDPKRQAADFTRPGPNPHA